MVWCKEEEKGEYEVGVTMVNKRQDGESKIIGSFGNNEATP